MQEPYSILGESRPRLSVDGTVRTGGMLLTAKAATNPTAVDIYKNGVATQISFKAIGIQIEKATELKYPLRPLNTDFFVIRRPDFNPEHLADKMLEAYGKQEEGDKIKRVRDFPIVLPFDTWLENMPHSLREFGSSGVKHWSDYGADGVRYCNEHSDIPVDSSGKALRRVFGGRQPVLRKKNDGLCLPNECDEYQSGACKMSGRLVFHVPGIEAGCLFELGTTSYYSMEQWRSKMLEVFAIRGRITGTHNGEAIFKLAKVKEEVSRLDPEKGAIKTTQWLVKLFVNADLTAMAAPALAHDNAAAALEGPQGQDDDVIQGTLEEINSDEIPF